jgi:methyl-accepting chemotaxis protein PixJ
MLDKKNSSAETGSEIGTEIGTEQSFSEMLVSATAGSSAGSATETTADRVERFQSNGEVLNPISVKAVKGKSPWFSNLSLRYKATALALLIGGLPVVISGVAAYKIAGDASFNQTSAAKKSRAVALSRRSSQFMANHIREQAILATLPAFAEPKVRAIVTQKEREALLTRYAKSDSAYESITVLDLNGDVIAGSEGSELKNQANRPEFQTAIKTGELYVAEPDLSEETGTLSIDMSSPIKDAETGKVIGVVMSHIKVSSLYKELNDLATNGDNIFIVDRRGRVILTNEEDAELKELRLKSVDSIFPGLSALASQGKPTSRLATTSQGVQKLQAIAPESAIEGMPSLGWTSVISTPESIALATQQQLLLTLEIGGAITLLLVGILAAIVSNRAIQPILRTAKAVEQIGQGEMSTRVDDQGTDEMAVLGQNINQMTTKIKGLLDEQYNNAARAERFASIAQTRDRDELQFLLEITLEEARQTLDADRVVVFQFAERSGSKVIGEIVKAGFPRAMDHPVADPCIPEALKLDYAQGRIVVNDNIDTSNLDPDHIRYLQDLQIKANLVVPIRQGVELIGLLIANQCRAPRKWTTENISYLEKFAEQLSLPLNSFLGYERQLDEAKRERERSQKLQMELIQLLGDVEGASSGDLTVRAQITDGEIGIVADFFNAIVENLRDIVTDVKATATQVNQSVSGNNSSIRQLASNASNQADQITETLNSVEQMTQSIQEVAVKARQAAGVSQKAATTAQTGGQAMERTVASIGQLRDTVGETAKKVKRLGESSQEISKVIELINQIALKTNLLAVNASIEAARAGEEGRGFAVVAEEVGALAVQSATATREIERIVDSIQQETSEVVQAMESSTAQVVEGTQMVESAKQSLLQIVQVSRQVDQLFQAISGATLSQVQTSQTVKSLMTELAEASKQDSIASNEVSDSLQSTVDITERLQQAMGSFKISAV